MYLIQISAHRKDDHPCTGRLPPEHRDYVLPQCANHHGQRELGVVRVSAPPDRC